VKYENALARWPSHPAQLSRLANVAMANGEPDLAIRLLNGLLESGQNDPVVHYSVAYAYLYVGQADKVKQELLKIADVTEKLPQALLLLARAQHYLGEMDEAIKNARAYLEKNPDDPEALGVLALLNPDSEHTDEARAAAEKTLSLSQDNLNALVTLGSLALGTQDAEQAPLRSA
jgi:tetratricopeptide (TPR) repeat protein